MPLTNFKKVVTFLTIILPLVSCGKKTKDECFAVKLGYNCCKACEVVDNDNDGVWGVENDEWCGLKSACFTNNKCFSEPFFPCCKNNEVVLEDDYGKWGIENEQWCGIGEGNSKSLINSKNKNNNDQDKNTKEEDKKEKEKEKEKGEKEKEKEKENNKDSKDKQNTNKDKQDNTKDDKNNHDNKNTEDLQERLNSIRQKLENIKNNNAKNKQNNTNSNSKISTSLPKVNMTSWQYNEIDDVYWQIDIFYCEKPADPNYESLGIFVPGKYFNATKNSDGQTYTCELNPSAKIDDYTVENAPMVLPVNTEGYMSNPSPQDYINEAKRFTEKGIIYIGTGCRGRLEGAPYGVTDLKAAIRYLRYNDKILPGSTENIFTLGFGSGGSQSILLGTSGDSPLYDKYLKAIGAIEGLSDAVKGSMSWCPDVQLDTGNEAYEWNMGSSRSNLADEDKELSDGLAKAYADYINAIQFKNSRGEVLTLTPSDKGNYQSGSYYDYILEEIEISLNNFLSRIEFPYVQKPSILYLNNGENYGMDPLDDDETKHGGPITIGDPIIYKTPEKYVNSLNSVGKWVTFDQKTQKAKVISLEGFILRFKRAMKKVGAYDDYHGATRVENVLFGYDEDYLVGAHFDSVMAKLLNGTEYAEAFNKDLKRKDALGSSVQERINMYNPLYFLNDYYKGYKTSKVAQFWRIQAGITQTENPLTTEYNLKLALENYGRTVDFDSIWNIGHIKTEYEGNSTENFIQWIKQCLHQK